MHKIKSPGDSDKPKILFVDDEDRILNSMKALFRGQYNVVTTTDGNEALQLLKEQKFELVVSDQRMPIMKGVDLLRQSKEIAPSTVRVLLTGFSDLADMVGSINDGEIFRFVSKPWDNKEIQDIVAEAVHIGIALSAEDFLRSESGSPGSHSTDKVDSVSTEAKPRSISDGIVIINGDAVIFEMTKALLPSHPLHQVKTHQDALAVMAQNEIAIVVSSMDGDHRKDTEFFSMLKRCHPQITSIIIAPSGDSEALISLINHARVFRYMFKPIREGLFNRYLDSAMQEYSRFKSSPSLLLTQKSKQSGDIPAVTPSMLVMMKGIKSFFKSKITPT